MKQRHRDINIRISRLEMQFVELADRINEITQVPSDMRARMRRLELEMAQLQQQLTVKENSTLGMLFNHGTTQSQPVPDMQRTDAERSRTLENEAPRES